jgi:uncharacterized metal-binding protein YceD (DUF177 family)
VIEGFGHRLTLDRIRDGERIELSADEGERRSIGDRLGLASLDRLDAHVTLGREGERIRASGRVRASLEQSCIATGEPVPEHVDEPFEVMFVPEPKDGRPDEEVELGAQDCDTVFYEGGSIDLGAAIADTLALAIDPYPRSREAEAALKEAGVISEAEAGPFGGLAEGSRSHQRSGGRSVRRIGETAKERRRDLKRNVVIQVGVERRRLRARLLAGRTS